MTKNKIRLILVTVILLLIVIVIIGSIIIFNQSSNSNTTNTTTSKNKPSTSNTNTSTTPVVITTKETANTLKQQAIDAINKNDYAKARNIFLEAQQQYVSLGDTDNVTDIDAQIYFIDHRPAAPTPPAQKIAGGSQ